jgi:cytochrome c peroxidase
LRVASLTFALSLLSQGIALSQTVEPVRALGLPCPTFPPDNAPSQAAIELGRRLFFDKRLSRTNSVSCATCHDPSHGFADPHKVSIGVEAREGSRNSPTVLNAAFVEPLMWDGKAATLEDQSLIPFQSREEFDLSVNDLVAKLTRQGYSNEFKAAFGRDVNTADLAKALASYQRSLTAGDSAFDRYVFSKDQTALSNSAKRGFEVFLESRCDACHLVMTPGLHPFALKNALFTDNKFHNLGVGTDAPKPDGGRYALTGDPADWGAFKTPSLRNVALTAPYFHDGSAATLMDVIDLYERGGTPNKRLDREIRPFTLTPEDKRDLVAFLDSLTSSSVPQLAQEESKIQPFKPPTPQK